MQTLFLHKSMQTLFSVIRTTFFPNYKIYFMCFHFHKVYIQIQPHSLPFIFFAFVLSTSFRLHLHVGVNNSQRDIYNSIYIISSQNKKNCNTSMLLSLYIIIYIISTNNDTSIHPLLPLPIHPSIYSYIHISNCIFKFKYESQRADFFTVVQHQQKTY